MRIICKYVCCCVVWFLVCASCVNENRAAQSSVSLRDSSLSEVEELAEDEESYEENMRRMVARLVKSVKDGNAAEFASLCRYPIERAYPLHDIVDSADMVCRYVQIFDDEIRNAVSRSKKEDWGGINWKGYTLDDGSWLWIDDDVYQIPYHSKAEKKQREELIKKDLATLPSGFAKGWYPEVCLLDTVSDMVYRIDVREKDSQATECRLMAYGKEMPLNGKPKFVISGHKELQGSAGTSCYLFPRGNEPDWMICDYWYESEIELYIDPDSDMTDTHGLKKAYWLDLIEE